MTDLKSPAPATRIRRHRLEAPIGRVKRPLGNGSANNQDPDAQRSEGSDWVSPDSRLGHALLRRRPGQRVVVMAPNGTFGVPVLNGRWQGRPRPEDHTRVVPPTESTPGAGDESSPPVPNKQLERWLDDGGALIGNA